MRSACCSPTPARHASPLLLRPAVASPASAEAAASTFQRSFQPPAGTPSQWISCSRRTPGKVARAYGYRQDWRRESAQCEPASGPTDAATAAEPPARLEADEE